MLMQQMLRMRLCTLTPAGATKCNCLPNGIYGGGRRFDRAMDCYKDENFACGVCIADEPPAPSQWWPGRTRTSTQECLRRRVKL